jgi:predicted N-acetyltransferase YhbS
MIEIRTYEGSATEFAQFSLDVWRQTYEGRMPLPLWDAPYFEWQWMPDGGENRDFLVAAYDGAKLVGSLLGEAFRFRLHDREFDATMGSWLTVHPDYRRQGIGTRLFEEQRKRHVERGAVFHLGFGYMGSAVSMGPQFWTKLSDNTVVLGKAGFWARVLDHRAAARWSPVRVERIGTRLLGLVQGRRPAPASFEGIRSYRPDDLDACLDLANALTSKVDMGYVWSKPRLGRQLQHRDLPRTVVLEQQGRVGGFVNYYRVEFLARGLLPVALVDVAAFGELAGRERRRLLRAALYKMAEEGIGLALILGLPCYPKSPFFRTGFVSMPASSLLLCVRMVPEFSLNGAKRLHVHWR